MTRPIVKWRPAASVLPEHLAEASRALARSGRDVNGPALENALLAARALPVTLDVIADNRASVGLGRARLSLLGITRPGPLPAGPLLAVAVLEPPVVEVRFFDAERLERARLRFAVDDDPTLDEAPVLRRFLHGPRGT